MRVVPFSMVDPTAWDSACERSAEAWCFHRHAWIEIEARILGSEKHAFAVCAADDSLVGILPLYVQKLPLGPFAETLLHSGLHRHTGLALVDGLSGFDRRAARSLALRAVFDTARAVCAERIQLNVQNLAPAQLVPGREEIPFWVTEHGFQLGIAFGPNGIAPAPGLSTLAADQLVVLDDGREEELFARLDSACRRAVRKAQRSGVTTEWPTPNVAAEIYLQLAARSAERTGETLAPRAYYDAVLRLPPVGEAARILVARHEGTAIGALLLLAAKGSLHFLGGVSEPAALALRPNDLLHWTAIAWGRAQGYRRYRLGPIFPELPRSWPVCTVSRFKGKFGGRSVPILHGSFFLHPEKYQPVAEQQLAALREGAAADEPAPAQAAPERLNVTLDPSRGRDLVNMLRDYGAIDLPLSFVGSAAGARVVCAGLDAKDLPPGVLCTAAPHGRSYFEARTDGRRRTAAPIYRALLPHVTFVGRGLRPLWTDAEDRAVLAWAGEGAGRTLLIGLDVVEELLRRRQGDAGRTSDASTRTKFGFSFERPNYLFDHQLDPERPTVPWADQLGFVVAELLSELAGWPLVEPLPGGARGLVLLTGDDDEAYLGRYDEQLRIVGELPITYFLVPKTRHTRETLGRLPVNVELGLHVDALDRPAEYAQLCREQARFLRELTGRPCRTLRNHGYLNDGYLGHLQAWEENAIALDFNLPGVDGTALNGSFLPLRVRRADGAWSDHYSLLTAFGDGMIEALGLWEWQARRRVRALVRQVEATRPGVLVFNFHPENIPRTRSLHRAVRRLAKRRGWTALGAEGYLEWLEVLAGLRFDVANGGLRLRSARAVEGLVLRVPEARRWRRIEVSPFRGETQIAVRVAPPE